MKKILFLFIPFIVLSCKEPAPPGYAIVIHGGAGNISPEFILPDRAEAIAEKLEEALNRGVNILEGGGSSMDAVEQVIMILEDSPHFNAGKGAVFTHEGRNEMDASIMDGSSLNAGAIAGVGDIKNPIRAARTVMEKSDHVFLAGAGASRFAAQNGVEIVDSGYFFTEHRWKALESQLEIGNLEKYGTVGCVALDTHGNLAAGTSTGGMTNKRFGRIGDSPIIGAGNYANNETCGVSATGHGEFFIRYTVAHDIAALIQYRGLTVEEAAGIVVHEKLENAGGKGGVICIDHKGNIAIEFNTAGMLRAYANAEGMNEVIVFD